MKKFLKLTAILLCICLILAGCGSSNSGDSDNNSPDSTEAPEVTGDLSYVLIYNPEIYDENQYINAKLTTGDLNQYVEAIINRADGPTDAPKTWIPYSTDIIGGKLPENLDLSGNKAETILIPYKEGDIHQFYCGESQRALKEFTCEYAGKYCNVWEANSNVNKSDLQKVGQEFDQNIFEQMTETFGKGRFVDNGGKVNILVYPMQTQGLMGFFSMLDLFAKGEVYEEEISSYGINTDHAIININSDIVNESNLSYANSTLAHEYQHLLSFSNYFYTVNQTVMRTWLNESMSGYVEEHIYPGTKELEGHYDSFADSTRIRHGQSLYNFDTTNTFTEFDIGVYGSVYLFAEYLVKMSGEDIFSKIHSYWKNSYSNTLSEAEAIAKSVNSDFYNKIDSSFEFNNVTFNNTDEEWLSKLTLNFYLSILNYDSEDPKAFENVESQALLYDEINPAEIEGGGRVIVALKDDSFEIPSNSDDGLIYVGLNENFEMLGIIE